MYTILLWDIDGTVLNFLEAESNSLKTRFGEYGLGECSDENVRLYSSINNLYWEKLERGEISKEGVLRERFAEFFRRLNIAGIDPAKFSDRYEIGLADKITFMENAKEILESLKGKYKQYAITNGAENVQNLRLKKAGIDCVFDGIFISDSVGYEKPNVKFFEYVLENIEPCKKEEILVIGDSLTSDIKGANNADLACCLYNPYKKEIVTDLRIDYEINTLNDIFGIIK